jgi:branched-chain amino acid transport system permease protein
MTAFIQALMSGVAIGCVYGLVALGFVLIYKATEVVSFAQGELMMVGGFFALTFTTYAGLSYWIAVPLTFAAAAVLGALINYTVLRPMVGQPVFTIVLATFAVGILMRAAVSMIPGWGTETYSLQTPFTGSNLHLGDAVVAGDSIAVIVATVMLVAALYVFFRFTRIGVALQAVSQNQLVAGYLGIPLNSMFSLIWGLAAGVAAVAGILLAPIAFVHSNIGFIGLKAFPAAVLGGFGSIPGALLGGLIIGLVEELSGLYLPEGFKSVSAYIVLLAVLMVRPQGLFGVSLRERV